MSLSKEQQSIVDHIKPLLDLIPVIQRLEGQIVDNPTNLGWMSDTTFITRKCGEILEQIEKKLNALETKVAQQANQVMLGTGIAKYQGEYCTISDNSTPYVKFPTSPTDPGYADFVKQLKIEDVRPHFPTVSAKIATELEKGNQVPYGLTGGLEKIISWNYKLRVTTRKSL